MNENDRTTRPFDNEVQIGVIDFYKNGFGERVIVRARGVVVNVPVDRIEHAWRNGFERHMA